MIRQEEREIHIMKTLIHYKIACEAVEKAAKRKKSAIKRFIFVEGFHLVEEVLKQEL